MGLPSREEMEDAIDVPFAVLGEAEAPSEELQKAASEARPEVEGKAEPAPPAPEPPAAPLAAPSSEPAQPPAPAPSAEPPKRKEPELW